jgi:hypothetical protein
MEYLTTIKTILNSIATIVMIIYTCILVKKYFINNEKIKNKEVLIYAILSFIYSLSK